jgi:hypothetical protein
MTMRTDVSIADRLGNGLVAGFIATAVLSALHEPLSLLTAAVGVRAPVSRIAVSLLRRHAVVGQCFRLRARLSVRPVLAARRRLRGRRGLAVMFVIAPLTGSGLLCPQAGLFRARVVALFHLAYGAILGAIYGKLIDTDEARGASCASRAPLSLELEWGDGLSALRQIGLFSCARCWKTCSATSRSIRSRRRGATCARTCASGSIGRHGGRGRAVSLLLDGRAVRDAGRQHVGGAGASAGASDRRRMGGARRAHRSRQHAADAAGQHDHRRSRAEPAPVAQEIARYLGSDLVCYRASTPAGLVARQADNWDPVLTWAREPTARFSC